MENGSELSPKEREVTGHKKEEPDKPTQKENPRRFAKAFSTIKRAVRFTEQPEKRKDIEIILGKDYSRQIDIEAKRIRERVGQVYRNQGTQFAQQDLGVGRNAILELPQTLRDDVLHDISTTLVECSDILGVGIPDIHFRLATEGLLTDIGGNYNTAALVTSNKFFDRPRLEINLVYLTALNRAYSQLPPQELTSIREGMQEAFAEEMFHNYHRLRYPKTWERTGQANKAGGEAYWNDRGEKLAKSFAKRYVDVKNSRSA